MAIQNRRGIHTDFDATKMVAGEFAVVQSGDPNNTNGTSVYICFQNGSAKRLTLIEDLDAVVGSLGDLETTDKTSIVDAINELAERESILSGTSSTGGSTRDKVVTCADFEAVDGALIAITLSQTNTVTDARFNVNGTGAKSIYSNYEASTDTSWLKKGTYLFVYSSTNGGRFTLIGATERIASDTAPVMDGTAAVGTSKKYARADHVHPSDTSRATVAALNETNAQVTQLKEDFGYYPEDAYTDFVQGAWNLLKPTTNANRLRSNDAFELQAGDTITMSFTATGFDGVVAIISKQGTLISDSGWKHVTYTYTASDNVYAIINEKKTNNSAIVPSENAITISIKQSIANGFSDVKSEFEDYDVTDKYMNWVVGTLNASGLPSNATYRLRTTDYIPFSAFHKMTWDSGYRTMVAFYDQDYAYLGGTAEVNTGIITREYLEALQSGIYYIKILFANPSVTTVTVDALADAHFTLYTINSQNNSYKDFIENDLPHSWSVPYRNILQMQGDGFAFAIQTDTHFNKEIPPYYNTIKNLSRRIGFDFIANLGDIIRGYEYDTVTDSYEEYKKAIKGLVDGAECSTFALMGNHDNGCMYATATGLIADAFLPGELFSLFERPTTTEDSAVVWGSREGLYFYRDFDRVRVVVLNTSDLPYQAVSESDINVNVMMISTVQANWFTQTALDTNKPVLVLSHAPLDGSITVTNRASIVSTMEAFVSGGGTIIANIAGHTHSIGATKTNGINYIICDNGGDLCEVFAVDLDARTITTQQIGKDFTGSRSFTF